MKFVQTIRFSTTRIEELRSLQEEWRRRGDARGLLGVKLLADRDRDNAYMIVAEFESYEQAMRNSSRPETDALAKRMQELVDGQLGYDNYDVISELEP